MVEEKIKTCTKGHGRKAVPSRTAVGLCGLKCPWDFGRERRTGIIRTGQIHNGGVSTAALITECEPRCRSTEVDDLFVNGLLNTNRRRWCPAGILQHHRQFVYILKRERDVDQIHQLTSRVEHPHRSLVVETRSILVGRAAVTIHNQPYPINPISKVFIAQLATYNVRRPQRTTETQQHKKEDVTHQQVGSRL